VIHHHHTRAPQSAQKTASDRVGEPHGPIIEGPSRWPRAPCHQRTRAFLPRWPSAVARVIARRWYFSPLLVIHAAVVVGLTALTLTMLLTTDPDDGANIGAGILTLPLVPMGLPWSLLNVYDKFVSPVLPMSAHDYPYPWWTQLVEFAALYGPALLNVVLHAVLVRHLARRRVRHAR